MACGGCKQRQEIGGQMVTAFRRGDMGSVKRGMGEMARSLREDVAGVVRVRKEGWGTHPISPPRSERRDY